MTQDCLEDLRGLVEVELSSKINRRAQSIRLIRHFVSEFSYFFYCQCGWIMEIDDY